MSTATAPVPKPQRRWTLRLEIGCDGTRDELIDELDQITDALRGGSDGCVSGSPSVGMFYEVKHKPDQTHENYIAELERYLDSEREKPAE